jgi:hypothetical protein
MAATPTASPITFQDLYVDLMGRLRMDSTNAATVIKAKRAINTALLDMHVGQGEKFPWAERQAVLVTQSAWTPNGTAQVVQGAAGLVLNDGTDSFNGDRDGNGIHLNAHPTTKFIFSGDTTKVYEWERTIIPQGGNMSAVYLGDTDAAITFRAYQPEYALADDFLKPVDARNFGDHLNIPLIDRVRFRRFYPNNTTPGTPRVATIFDRYIARATPSVATQYLTKRILFHPPPSTVIQIPYSYVTSYLAVNNTSTTAGGSHGAGWAGVAMTEDDDEPIVPLQIRHAIVYHALADWYRDRRDDARSAEARGLYTEIVNRAIADVEVTSPRPRFRPSRAYASRARRPYSGRGRFDTGGRFDRLEDL